MCAGERSFTGGVPTIEAGNPAGYRTILIEKPYDPQYDINERNRPEFIVHDWRTAGQIILAESYYLTRFPWIQQECEYDKLSPHH